MLLAGAAAGWVALNVGLPVRCSWSSRSSPAWWPAALWAGIAGSAQGTHRCPRGDHHDHAQLRRLLPRLLRTLASRASSRRRARSTPSRSRCPPTQRCPKLLGDRYGLHLGFLIALVAVFVVWWILDRSALGYRFRAVGENPNAARTAGIDVGRIYTTVMLIAGALVGLAGANQVLGTVTSGVTVDLDAGIGFDAITVALLGRSHPFGILGAGLLFGAFKAGGFSMQASEGIPVDIVLVIQSLIVLFLAAPPLVRAIFRLPSKEDVVSTTTSPAAPGSSTRRGSSRSSARRPRSSSRSSPWPSVPRCCSARRRATPPSGSPLPTTSSSCPTSRCRPRAPRCVMVVLMALISAASWVRYATKRQTPVWAAAVFAFVGMVGFLSWAAAGGTIPVVGLLAGSLAVAVPLIFGALGGVLGERSGVVNIAIDGQLLAGAFAAALVGSIVGSTWAGVLGAMVAGMLVAAGARRARDQLLRRPGDRRRRAQRPGDRGDQLHVRAGPGTQHSRPEHAAQVRAAPHPGPGRHPADRPDLLPADPDRLPALRRRRGRHLGALPHPLGTAGPGGRRAPQGRRHGRHQREPHPLPHGAARRRDRRHAEVRSTRWSRCPSSTGR